MTETTPTPRTAAGSTEENETTVTMPGPSPTGTPAGPPPDAVTATSGDGPGEGRDRAPAGASPDGPFPPGPAPLSLPITAVTCLEDRAQIERRGTVRLAAGVQRLRIGPVTPITVDRSLRAEIVPAAGGPGTVPTAADPAAQDSGGPDRAAPDTKAADARVVDARIVRAYTPPHPDGPGEDASELRREVHTLEREIHETEMHRQRLESRLAVIAQARADLFRDITEGAGAGDADPERWTDRLDRVEGEAGPRNAELHALHRRLRDLAEELKEAAAALLRTENEPEELSAVLELVVEADRAGPAELRVVHLVPCALWRPAYRAALAPDGRSVLLETDAVVWQRTGEDWNGVRLALSTARPTLAASPPGLAEDELALRDRSAEERRTVEVDLREEDIRTIGGESPGSGGPGSGSAEMPGLDDGGEVRVMTAPVPVNVVGDGRPHRVHLTAFTAACESERTCSPELSPLVGQVAVLPNESGHVLLSGPVDLVRGSGFVGRGELRFAGLGEQVRLPFGSEDDYRVVRHVEESRETVGLTGINHRTVITRTVRLFVSRLGAPGDREAGPVVVRERVPVSEVSAVEIRLRKDACAPQPDDADADGIVRYDLLLGPGERREITLVYEITAAASVQGL